MKGCYSSFVRGEIIVGVLLGPSVFGLIEATDTLATFNTIFKEHEYNGCKSFKIVIKGGTTITGIAISFSLLN